MQPSCPPVAEGLLELFIFLDVLRKDRITAILPYFPYERSDKKDEPRVSITARLVAGLLEAAGANRVLTVDLHSPQIEGLLCIPCDHVSAVDVLCEHFSRVPPGVADVVVVAADVGAVKHAERVAGRLRLPFAVVDKRRSSDAAPVKAVNLYGQVAGQRALIVDDEVVSAGTLT
jgi:ribose-phosphate pyrophosphokinase